MTATLPSSLPRTDFLAPAQPKRADAATLGVIFVVTLLVIPARLVFRALPLQLTPANVVALLVGMCWFCAQFTTTLGMAKGRNAARTALFLYIVAVMVTYGYATFGYLPVDELGLADHAAILMVATASLGLGLCDGVRTTDRLDFVLRAVVVCGAFSALVGLLQFTADLDLTQYLKLPGLRSSSDALFVFERSAQKRVSGTMGHPIEFGVVCSMLLPLASHYLFQARARGEKTLRWWVCVALIASGLMFSVSRSAVLGLAAAGLVLFIGWSNRRRLRVLGVSVVFLAAMKVAVPGLIGTFYSLFANAGNDSSVQWRTHDYPIATAEILRHLWFGHGYGTWYAPKHIVFDNQYILTMVEGGIVGMAAFVIVFFAGLYACVRARYLTTDSARRDLGLSIAASLVVPLVGAATFDLASFKTGEGLSFLLVGAAGALLRITKATEAEVSPS